MTKVSVDTVNKFVAVREDDGTEVIRYLWPDTGHNTIIEFDPNDPQPVLRNQVTGLDSLADDPAMMARKALETALPSQGAVDEALGTQPVLPAPVGLAPEALRETGREGSPGEREVIPAADLAEASVSASAVAEARHFGEGDYEDWKKDGLVTEAENRGLDASGTRQDIIDRLRENDGLQKDDEVKLEV